MKLMSLKPIENIYEYENYKSNKEENINYNDLNSIIEVSASLIKSVNDYNYLINNLSTISKEEFFRIYNYFYDTNNDELVTRIVNKTFNSPKEVYLKTTETRDEYIQDGYGSSFNYEVKTLPLKYKVYTENNTNLDTNKIYTLKEIKQLMDDKTIIYSGVNEFYDLNGSELIKEDNNIEIQLPLESDLAFDILKEEFIKEDLSLDISEIKDLSKNIYFNCNKLLNMYSSIIKYQLDKSEYFILDKNKLLSHVNSVLAKNSDLFNKYEELNKEYSSNLETVSLFKDISNKNLPISALEEIYQLNQYDKETLVRVKMLLTEYDILKQEFETLMNNKDTLSSERFMQLYFDFYSWDDEKFKKTYIVNSFNTEPKIVTIDTNISLNGVNTLRYKIITNNDSKFKKDKIYSYNDLLKLLNNDTYILANSTKGINKAKKMEIISHNDLANIDRYLYNKRIDLNSMDYYKSHLDELLKLNRINYLGLINVLRESLSTRRLKADYSRLIDLYKTSYDYAYKILNKALEIDNKDKKTKKEYKNKVYNSLKDLKSIKPIL